MGETRSDPFSRAPPNMRRFRAAVSGVRPVAASAHSRICEVVSCGQPPTPPEPSITTAAVTAPPFCDLTWHQAGAAIFTAERTPLYDAAVSCARTGMEGAGFTLDGPHVELDLTGCTDIAIVAKRLTIWTGAARKALAFAQKRDAALKPLTGEAIAGVQAGLVAMLAENEWALGTRADLAEQFAHADGLSRAQHLWALDILGAARSAVESVDARLSTEAGAEAIARAYHAEIREDLLAACVELTDLDHDRCREANGRGWSAVASAPGHRLANMDSFTILQAAHAWSLVHPHRRQLSEDLRGRLFGIS
ncbi:hypothetical protein G3T14_10710 [Methylobacterium sp. BTF04]|uniref:hypothetical protein n=1 Tax=Methylobacterium sp. BTF04 TaxID=2708300 RepID=UPI0013D45FF9|nr:hypothetical protein [Methylobacterium sp. BTF04]NEU12608.1 hypothetical protein [Methylobacterium sp. BTF04]